MSRSLYISKTKFLHGLQCPKLLWSDYNAKHLFPEVSEALQAVFDQGHEVGSLAKKMFPNGIEIEVEPTDFEGAIEQTRKLLSSRRPLFEAALSDGGGFAKADILDPVGTDEWDIIEVKSTTSLKDEHVPDVAFQAWVFTQAGLKIRRCFLCHINNQFIKHGDIDPKEFFTLQDVTAKVATFTRQVEDKLSDMGKIVRSAKCPDVQIGPQCDSPYTCPLHEHCWSFVPAHSVFDLYDDKKGRRWDLFKKRNILRISEIPADYPLSPKQLIQRKVAQSGTPHVERTKIQTFLKQLEYPLHFLDFETFSTAIPIFDGTRPYEQIPFQFSLHIVRKAGEKPEHRKFLAQGKDDPRVEFLHRLNEAIEPTGSILVFNASFEKGRMKECAELMPEYEPWVKAMNGRIVDLLNPFKAFHFYHPSQNGSASMKNVLPALTGKDYSELEIQEGGAASREFIRVTFGDVSESERKRVRKALDEYCGQDTEGMVWILDALSGSEAALLASQNELSI